MMVYSLSSTRWASSSKLLPWDLETMFISSKSWLRQLRGLPAKSSWSEFCISPLPNTLLGLVSIRETIGPKFKAATLTYRSWLQATKWWSSSAKPLRPTRGQNGGSKFPRLSPSQFRLAGRLLATTLLKAFTNAGHCIRVWPHFLAPFPGVNLGKTNEVPSVS